MSANNKPAYPKQSASFTASDEGCIIDGHHGIYMGGMILEYALSQGYKGDKFTTLLHGRSLPKSAAFMDSHVIDIDNAIAFLNTLAPEGFTFGHNEGGNDFGLWRNEEDWEEVEQMFLATA